MSKVKRKRRAAGRPITGTERKQPFTVMIEPSVAAMLRQIGGENLSRGVALAAAAQQLLLKRAGKAGR
jgi:hypothetical protein